MLTNLNWLSEGSPYPPVAEKKRIEKYTMNRMLFLSEHSKEWKAKFKELAKRFRKKDSDVETVINYHQLLSKKTADFSCSEPPTFETEGDTDKLVKLLEKQNFYTKLYEAFLDLSRYGNGIFKIVKKSITIVSPMYWFPICDPTDLKNIKHHVIAYPINPGTDGIMTELYVEIHGIGTIEQRTYSFDGEKAEIRQLKNSTVNKTGLDDFAIFPLTNITHSEDIYGIDDYIIINSIIQKIMWRLHCIDTVLDKHSEPSLSGPSSALDYDERTGLYFLNLGNYFKRTTNEDPDIKYITWDGNLEASFKEVDMLLNQLYILTEMGQAFLEGGGGGETSSGTALKLRMVSPRIKAKRLTSINAATVKSLISIFAYVNDVDIDYDTLTIKWNDGLPIDEVEETNRLINATGGKPIMSQYAALKERGLTDAEVEEELEQIRMEQAASSPFVLGGINLNNPISANSGEE